jgi:hypothetical protein
MSKSMGAVIDAGAAATGGGEAQRRRVGLAALGLVFALVLGMLGVRLLAGLDGVVGSRTAPEGLDVAGASDRAMPVGGIPSSFASAQWAHVPPLAQLAIARALGSDDRAYWARAGAGASAGTAASAGVLGASSRTPAQNLRERYGRAGVSVLAPAGVLDLSLRAVHAGERALPLGRPIPQASRNRVTYRRGSVEEWYANGPLGLEQGFTVPRLPQPAVGDRSAAGELSFDLALRGSSLRPRALTGAGGGVEFLARDGAPALRYSRLSATDATGRSLPTHMTLRGRQLLLSVDAAGARYPLTLDPLVQQAELSASNGSYESGVGQSVAIDGSTIVVGAWGAIVDGGAGYPNQQGAVYVFEKPASGWANATQSATLVASDADEYDVDNVYGDALGSAVAISGDTIVANAPRATAGGETGVPFAGKLYVFVKPEHGGWVNSTETAQLSASDALEYDYLGASLATDGQTVVAGEPNDSGEGTSGPGAAYVFSKPSGGWKSILQTGELTASGGSEAALGSSVAVEGKTVVAGAPYATAESKAGAGAVYVYTEPADGWKDESPTATLTSGGAAHETLGTAVALKGSTLLAGAANNYDPGTAPSSAYVFTAPAGDWGTTNKPAAQLLPSDPASGEHFGGSVGLSEGTAVVGAQFAPVGETLEQGAFYVYSAPAGGWSGTPAQTAKLSAKEGIVQQAESVAVSGPTIVDGAPYAQSGHGAAFVFGSGEGSGQGEGEKTGEPEKTPEKEITFAKPASNTSLTYTSTASPIEREDFIGFPLSVPPGQALGCSGNECTYAITCRRRSEACIGSATLEDISSALSSTPPLPVPAPSTSSAASRSSMARRASASRQVTVRRSRSSSRPPHASS